MNPDEGRLQTGEHILARLIEERVSGAKVVIAKFFPDHGLVEFKTQDDLRQMDLRGIERDVNVVISKKLVVEKRLVKRNDVLDLDISKIPESVKEIRIVEIAGFDMRPCRDPHVDNTSQIGRFFITGVERAGKDRYRFSFRVENP